MHILLVCYRNIIAYVNGHSICTHTHTQDLISELKSVLSFNLKHTVLAMMEPKALYLAQCLHK